MFITSHIYLPKTYLPLYEAFAKCFDLYQHPFQMRMCLGTILAVLLNSGAISSKDLAPLMPSNYVLCPIIPKM